METLKEEYVYTEVNWHPTSEKIAEDGEFTFGVYLTNCAMDYELEEAVLAWAGSIDEEGDVNLTIRLRLRDVFKELYEGNSYEEGSVDEDAMPLFDAMRKDCEWVIEQIKLLKGKSNGL